MAGMYGGTMHAGVPPPPPPPMQEHHAAADSPDDNDDLALFRLHALQTRGDWSAHDDGDGRLFYYNASANASQWEPPAPFAGIEGELMMALMLQHAVARSGFWTAHDAGHDTLYYFNERTRMSVWERPEDWGVIPPPPPPAPPAQDDSESREDSPVAVTANDADAADCVQEERDNDTAAASSENDRAKAKQPKSSASASAEPTDSVGGDASVQSGAAATTSTEATNQVQEEAQEDEGEEEEEEPPSAEELAAAAAKEAAERKRIESFRQMLRDKKVMPFTKWSAAMPRIVSDPRFMAIATYVRLVKCACGCRWMCMD